MQSGRIESLVEIQAVYERPHSPSRNARSRGTPGNRIRRQRLKRGADKRRPQAGAC